MLVVLDTNIWISSLLLPASSAGSVVALWRKAHFDIALSEPILSELKRVLMYPKIAKRLKLSIQEIDNYVEMLSFLANTVDIQHINVNVESDSNDSPILATLIASHADYLITGDQDLLDLKLDYPILTLAEFCRKLHL